jgi:hypothetical protein
MDADNVRVRAVIFSHWGGLMELTWTIDRAFPHAIQTATQTLVEYDSGIRF